MTGDRTGRFDVEVRSTATRYLFGDRGDQGGEIDVDRKEPDALPQSARCEVQHVVGEPLHAVGRTQNDVGHLLVLRCPRATLEKITGRLNGTERRSEVVTQDSNERFA